MSTTKGTKDIENKRTNNSQVWQQQIQKVMQQTKYLQYNAPASLV